MYRAGGPADVALPWSRTNIRPWTTALTAAAALGLVLPQLMLLAHFRSRPLSGLGVGHALGSGTHRYPDPNRDGSGDLGEAGFERGGHQESWSTSTRRVIS